MQKFPFLVFALSLSFVALAASAHDGRGQQNWNGSERSFGSPPEVLNPPTGYPGGAMSTVDSAHPTMINRPENRRMERRADATPIHDWVSKDEFTMEQAAPVVPMNPALRRFYLERTVNKLHHMNQTEIALAKLGESRAKSTEVLNFSHRIRNDHEHLDKEVVALAKKKDLRLENFQPATFEKDVTNRLHKLEGSEFEMAYIDYLNREHDGVDEDLRAERSETKDTEMQRLIDRTLPLIAEHQPSSAMLHRSRAGFEGENLGH